MEETATDDEGVKRDGVFPGGESEMVGDHTGDFGCQSVPGVGGTAEEGKIGEPEAICVVIGRVFAADATCVVWAVTPFC